MVYGDKRVEIEFLQKTPPFHQLSQEDNRRLAGATVEKSCPEGLHLFHQEDPPAEELYFILEGKVELFVGEEGRSLSVVDRAGPFEFLDETTLFLKSGYPFSARAVGDVRYLVLPRGLLKEMLQFYPGFYDYMVRFMAFRLQRLYRQIDRRTERISLDDEMLDGSAASETLHLRIQEVMQRPVITGHTYHTVGEIAAIMDRHRVSSVVVTPPGDNIPLGIITESDLVKRTLGRKKKGQVEEVRAEDVMTPDLITVRDDDFCYQAYRLMVQHGTKHLVAVNSQGVLSGMVTARDLVRQQKPSGADLTDRIELSNSMEELSSFRPEVDRVLLSLLEQRATAAELTALITEFYDRITRKIIQVAEKEMNEEGYGPPPVAYCWISMGSSGRKEQFTRTDQDHGIIFEDVPQKDLEKTRQYYLRLGEKITAGLEMFGFSRCEGGVMANNPEWCRSYREWCRVLQEWVDSPQPEYVRLMTIFLDFRFLYGKKALYYLLRNVTVKHFRDAPALLVFLVKDNLERKVPLGFFRGVQTERSGEHRHQLNLKTAALVHVVDCIRALSLREGILATNTKERLAELHKREVFKAREAEFLEEAYETLLMLLVQSAVTKMKKGVKPDTYIDPNRLSNLDKERLVDALAEVKRLQKLTGAAFYVYS